MFPKSAMNKCVRVLLLPFILFLAAACGDQTPSDLSGPAIPPGQFSALPPGICDAASPALKDAIWNDQTQTGLPGRIEVTVKNRGPAPGVLVTAVHLDDPETAGPDPDGFGPFRVDVGEFFSGTPTPADLECASTTAVTDSKGVAVIDHVALGPYMIRITGIPNRSDALAQGNLVVPDGNGVLAPAGASAVASGIVTPSASGKKIEIVPPTAENYELLLNNVDPVVELTDESPSASLTVNAGNGRSASTVFVDLSGNSIETSAWGIVPLGEDFLPWEDDFDFLTANRPGTTPGILVATASSGGEVTLNGLPDLPPGTSIALEAFATHQDGDIQLTASITDVSTLEDVTQLEPLVCLTQSSTAAAGTTDSGIDIGVDFGDDDRRSETIFFGHGADAIDDHALAFEQAARIWFDYTLPTGEPVTENAHARVRFVDGTTDNLLFSWTAEPADPENPNANLCRINSESGPATAYTVSRVFCYEHEDRPGVFRATWSFEGLLPETAAFEFQFKDSPDPSVCSACNDDDTVDRGFNVIEIVPENRQSGAKCENSNDPPFSMIT